MSKQIAATQITMYLCNQKKPCHKSPICGKDCKHTNDKRYALHRGLFNEFKPMLSPSEVAGGKPVLYLFEKEDEDNDTKNFTYHQKAKGDE